MDVGLHLERQLRRTGINAHVRISGVPLALLWAHSRRHHGTSGYWRRGLPYGSDLYRKRKGAVAGGIAATRLI